MARFMCDNNGSVARVLADHRDEIYASYENASVSLMKYKMIVIAIIKENYKETDGAKKIINKIMISHSKLDLLQYLCNIMVFDKQNAAV